MKHRDSEPASRRASARRRWWKALFPPKAAAGATADAEAQGARVEASAVALDPREAEADALIVEIAADGLVAPHDLPKLRDAIAVMRHPREANAPPAENGQGPANMNPQDASRPPAPGQGRNGAAGTGGEN